jgi:hypothetical protein
LLHCLRGCAGSRNVARESRPRTKKEQSPSWPGTCDTQNAGSGRLEEINI